MQIRILCAALAWSVCVTTPALAQFKEQDAGGPKLGNSQVQYWRVGLTVRAMGGPCRGIVGTTAVPVDWPEQQVRIVDEETSPGAKVTERTVGGTVKQMVVTVANLPAGREAKAIRTMEIRRYAQLAPDDTGVFVLPELKKLDRKLRIYLAPSPKIESRNARIRKLAKQIGAEEEKAWDKVEAIYDWVRENIEYKKGSTQVKIDNPTPNQLSAIISSQGVKDKDGQAVSGWDISISDTAPTIKSSGITSVDVSIAPDSDTVADDSAGYKVSLRVQINEFGSDHTLEVTVKVKPY